MTQQRKGMSRYLRDVIEDTKDLLVDITDSLGDVERDTRASMSRALRPDDRDRRGRRAPDRYTDDHDRRERRGRRDADRYGDERTEGLEDQLAGLRDELRRLGDLMEKDSSSEAAGKSSTTSK
ncbi:hypothetical protein [Streptomyces sp. NPDC023327]|uniref:hypothetical protein n=1 Tax=Streptomyces sp. NPDC023327 TaxID=3157088 RepID=UPI003403292A